jgi:hypothetical protein
MEKSPSREASSSSASQDIPNIFYNLNFHEHVHNSLPLVPVLSQISPTTSSDPISLRSISLLSYVPVSGSSKWSFSTDVNTKTLYAFLFFPIHAAGRTHLIHLDLITLLIFGKEYKS